MIRRSASILVAVIVAYVALYYFGNRLPPLALRAREVGPPSLNQLISDYVLRDERENIHFVQSATRANWESSEGVYTLYELADGVPASREVYGKTGLSVEALYETFLLSIRVGSDQSYVDLLNAFKQAQSGRKAKGRNLRGKRPTSTNTTANDQLPALLTYLESQNRGPSAAALGRSLREFYSGDRPKIVFPGSQELNMRRVTTSPELHELRDESHQIPVVEFLVPAVSGELSHDGKRMRARVEKLRLAELSLQRPWLDWSLLTAHRDGPWLGADPQLFGSGGPLERIPIRLVLVEKPILDVAGAVIQPESNAKVMVGPFEYSAQEIHLSGTKVQLKPSQSQWVVLAVVTRAI